MKKYITEKNILIASFILVILLLLAPYKFAQEGVLFGDFSYYHLRISEEIVNNKIPIIDEHSYNGRAYILNPYHLVLAGVGNLISLELASSALPFIFGLLSALMFYLILRKLNLKIEERALIMLILIFSPLFVYTFSISNEFFLALFFLLLGAYLHIIPGRIYAILSILFLSVSVLFSILNFPLIILLIFSYNAIKKNRLKKTITSIILVLLLTLPYYGFIYDSFGLPEKINFTKINIIQNSISDLGSVVGFSAFTVLLSIVGFVITWKYKRKLYPTYILIITLLITSFYLNYSNIFLNFVLSLFAGIGFFRLIKMKWQLYIIKRLTILVLICGIIFSMLSYLNRINELQPSVEVIESLTWLKENSDKKDLVLSHYSKGFWIEYMADRPVMMDSLFPYAPNPNKRYNDSETIFYEVHLDKTKVLLNDYNIKYIWIDKEMKDGLVWNKEKEGILFLFRNNETFEKVYNNSETQIWKIKKVD